MEWRIHLAGLGLCGAFAILVIASHNPPIPWWLYLTVIYSAWIVLFYAWRSLGAENLSAIIFWALVLRLVAAFSLPIYEDDDWRYRWDGWQVATLNNPYVNPPLQSFADPSVPAAGQIVLDHINHPDLPTIYGPVCQLFFALAYLIDPWQLWPLKLVICLAEISLLGWLYVKRPGRNLIWYAWCPLLIQETWCSAHPDALAMLPAIIGADLLVRGRPFVGGLLLGIALATRLTVLPVIILFSLFDLSCIGWVVLSTCCCYLPFILSGGYIGLESTRLMLQEWRFNDIGHAFLTWLFGSWGRQLSSGLALVGVLFAAWWLRQRERKNAEKQQLKFEYMIALIMAWTFLWSPVINPWYMLWLVPALVVKPSPWILGILLSMPICYLTGHIIGDNQIWTYDHPWWVRVIEITVISLGLLLSLKHQFLTARVTSHHH